MNTHSRVKLNGFESALADWIASNVQLNDQPISVGRNLFVSDMPEVEDIQQTEPDFDSLKEPTIAVYTDPGLGVQPGPGRGSRMEWNVRLVLRFGVVPESAKVLLEELITDIIKRTPGVKSGAFMVKGVNIITRPTVFARQGDGHAYTTCALKFFVVTLGI